VYLDWIIMGGVKKKTISSKEKIQTKQGEEVAKPKQKKEGGKQQVQKREEFQDKVRDEKTALNQMKSLKAMTLYSVSKALGVTVSAANQFLKSLESKGIVERVGGFSSHYIYKFKAQE
jgi:small subunit ribosomal protein S25e